MQFGFEIVSEAAKRKREGDKDDAPTQASMRPTKMARNPSTDQKKIRRQMARQKVGERDKSGWVPCPRCGKLTPPDDLAEASGWCLNCDYSFGGGYEKDQAEQEEWMRRHQSSARHEAFPFRRQPGVHPGSEATPDEHRRDENRADAEWEADHARRVRDAGFTTTYNEFGDEPSAEEKRRQQHRPLQNIVPTIAQRSASTMNFEQRERELLRAMARATPAEAQRLDGELQSLRAARTAAVAEARDLHFASEIVADHLTPVIAHTRHTAETDWLSDEADELSSPAPQTVQNEMVAEATLWYDRLHVAVRSDAEELAEQAVGMARRTAGRYGEHYAAAQRAFLDHVAFMQRRAFEAGDVDDGWDGTLVQDDAIAMPMVESVRFTPHSLMFAAHLGGDAEMIFEAADSIADQSGTGQSTITDYDGLAPVDEDPWLSEDWPGADGDEVPSDRAPVIQENKDGSNSERNQQTHSSLHARSWQQLAAAAGMPAESIERIAAVQRQHGLPDAAMPGLLREAGVHVAADEVKLLCKNGHTWRGEYPGEGSTCPTCGEPAVANDRQAYGPFDKDAHRVQADGYTPIADESGQGVSSLPTPEDDDEVAWEWEIDTQEKGAADVANVPTPPPWPQPKNSSARQAAFRDRVRANLRSNA